jgi:Arc/MetJ-type ribon-helix-helix transcriptional regulator
MKRAKLAVSLPAEVAAGAKAAVAAGRSPSVSALVGAALTEKLQRDRLDEVLAEMDRKLGPVDEEARRWARRALWG